MRTFRISTNTLGNGFIECVANETLLAIRDAQPAQIRGTAVMVPALEGNNAMGVGRFGWKNQHRSLESFSADAYLNEMGITSPLFPDENTSSGRCADACTEDSGAGVPRFALSLQRGLEMGTFLISSPSRKRLTVREGK